MTPLPGAILLLALPILASVITFLLRRWNFAAALVAIAATSALALLCLRLPLDRSAFVLGQEVAFGRPIVIGGRTLMLDTTGQVWLAFAFGLSTLLFLLAGRISQGRLFFPVSLAMLGLYVLVALVNTFSLAVLAFATSATLSVFIIEEGSGRSIRGGQRSLIITLLAVPFLLAAAWLLDQSRLQSTGLGMVSGALLPAAFGFGLLLAIFPFGTWIPALTADAPPLVSAFLLAAGQAMVFYLVTVFLRATPWAMADRTALRVIQLAGLVMVASGGLMAAVQRDLGRLFGYAALSDLGYVLLALGSEGSQALTLASLHMVNRSASIALAAGSLAILRQRLGTDRLAGLAGAAHRLPIAAGGMILGMLALAGFPLTAGFAGHWAVGRTVSAEQWPWVLLMLASTAGIAIGALRALSAMLTAPDGDALAGARQPVLASLLVLLLAALTVILGLYPQLFMGPIEAAAGAFSLF